MRRGALLVASLTTSLLMSALPIPPAVAQPTAPAQLGSVAAARPAAATPSASKLTWKLRFTQVDQSTSIKVTVDPSVLRKASKLKLTATMKYGRKTTRTVTCSQVLATLDEASSFACNLKDYGKWSIAAKFYKGKKKVRTNKAVSLGVVADEYIIAPLSGTLPGTMFTPSLWGANSIRGNGEKQIPVIVRLTRAHQWNWEKLPAGVYAVPYLTRSQAAKRTTMNDYKAPAITPIKAYIKDLRKLNKNSVFHLYVNDYTAHLVHGLLYANKIPKDRYTITFLSDGTHSYAQFAANYAVADPAAAHQKLVDQWTKAMKRSYQDGKPHMSAAKGRAAIYAAVDIEPSATWWLGRPALLNPNADPFAAAAQANPKIVAVNLGAKLTALQNEGAAAVTAFKELYNFNDAYFADAIKAKKQVMLFLGTRVDGTEKNFADYAGFAVKYYGNKYGYYYKGHPATPTENFPDKQKELKKLGMIDVQASVPAELILFFNPNISMSGYGSTTWESVPKINPDIAEGLFATSKAGGTASDTYKNIIKWYMTPKPSTGAVSALPGDFEVEFSDKVAAEKGYDIAMWASAEQSITYYRLVDGAYIRVS